MSLKAKHRVRFIVVCSCMLLIGVGMISCGGKSTNTQQQATTILEPQRDTTATVVPSTALSGEKAGVQIPVQTKVEATKRATHHKRAAEETTTVVTKSTQKLPAADTVEHSISLAPSRMLVVEDTESNAIASLPKTYLDTTSNRSPLDTAAAFEMPQLLPAQKRRRPKVLGITIPNIHMPKPKRRMDRGIEKALFIPKGYWSGGVNVSYSESLTNNFEFLVVKDWNAIGYKVQVSPYLSYFYRDNQSVGMRFAYRRSLLNLKNITLSFGDDLNLSLKDLYSLEQVYSGTLFHRSYVGLGNGRRIGLFNETRFTMGGGQGKYVSGSGAALQGSYQDIFELEIGIKPGISIFIMDNIAFETAVGVLGFKYRRVDQIFNQLKVGSRSTSSANFKIDLFSISMGMSIYL